MNAPFTLDELASRNMNPEKLETLRRVFMRCARKRQSRRAP